MPNPRSHTKQWQIINTTTWLASDTLTIKNIASYAEFTHDIFSPLFSTNFKTAGMAGYAGLYYNVINQGSLGGALPPFAAADAMFGISGFANSLNGIPVGMYSLSRSEEHTSELQSL